MFCKFTLENSLNTFDTNVFINVNMFIIYNVLVLTNNGFGLILEINIFRLFTFMFSH